MPAKPKPFRKGQMVWILCPTSRHGLPTPLAGTVARVSSPDTVFVRFKDGLPDAMSVKVLDFNAKQVYPNQRAALEAAALQCWEKATAAMNHGTAMMSRYWELVRS